MTTKQFWVAGVVLVAVIVVGWAALSKRAVMEPQDGAMMEKESGAMMDEKKDGAMMEKPEGSMMPKDEGMMPKEEGTMMQKPEGSMMEGAPGAMMEKGSYEAYEAAKIARAATGKVVLFFRASWCPTCRTLDADIRAHLGEIPAGVTILDVDYDASVALRQKYGVTYQHTLIQVDANGAQIAKWANSPSLVALLGNVK